MSLMSSTATISPDVFSNATFCPIDRVLARSGVTDSDMGIVQGIALAIYFDDGFVEYPMIGLCVHRACERTQPAVAKTID